MTAMMMIIRSIQVVTKRRQKTLLISKRNHERYEGEEEDLSTVTKANDCFVGFGFVCVLITCLLLI